MSHVALTSTTFLYSSKPSRLSLLPVVFFSLTDTCAMYREHYGEYLVRSLRSFPTAYQALQCFRQRCSSALSFGGKRVATNCKRSATDNLTAPRENGSIPLVFALSDLIDGLPKVIRHQSRQSDTPANAQKRSSAPLRMGSKTNCTVLCFHR